MKISIGTYKFWWERLRGYLGIISLLLAWRMNILLSPFSWWWYPLGIVLSVVVVYLDKRFVVADENAMGLKKNTEFQEMKKTLERIEERLKND